jgi:peptide chain release factor 2
MSERNALEEAINSVKGFASRLEDSKELAEIAEADGDEDLWQGVLSDLQSMEKDIGHQALLAMLSGEADKNDAFLEIHAGAGGTEACDWADMLLRMYLRWAERRGFKTEIAEISEGDEAGVKSVTVKVCGHNAYGWLKTESGVHRLVRISPFDSNSRRHTSFASVWVYPVIDESIHIDINEKDCRIDTYRASGAGGQHINKTDSAVRITHIPTGIVVQSQSQRSQFQNRDEAWSMLRAKLYELEMRKRQEAADNVENSKSEIGWGSQIRSYVLQPYQMVKDLRTGEETSDTKGVLDGDIDRFLESSLAANVTAGNVV